ncbi:MAG TPA: hypothetical protein VIO94_12765, partial [Phenylobacterium sp.]
GGRAYYSPTNDKGLAGPDPESIIPEPHAGANAPSAVFERGRKAHRDPSDYTIPVGPLEVAPPR